MNKLLVLLFLLVCSSSYGGNRFFRVVFNSNSSDNATIIWDQFQCGGVHLYLDSVDHGNDLNQYKFQFTKFKKRAHKGLNNYSLELDSLKAGQKYYFIVKDDEGLSKRYYFETTPNDSNARLSLIAGGDSRTQRTERQHANVLVSKLKAHAVLFNGDFTASDIPSQWKMWFEDWELSIAPDGRITPLIVSRGNHEHSNLVVAKLFSVPRANIAYNVELGGDLLNVITLNSEINKKAQVKFLKRTLSDHDCFKWQITQYHRPCRPHVEYKLDGVDQYKYWIPLLEAHKNMKLILESDSHTCKWTWPILKDASENADEGFVRDDKNGIVYIGEGCWGAPIRWPSDPKSWTRDCEQVYSFKYIFVDAEKIEVRTVEYLNSQEADFVGDKNRFEISPKVKLWTPKNGNLILIEK